MNFSLFTRKYVPFQNLPVQFLVYVVMVLLFFLAIVWVIEQQGLPISKSFCSSRHFGKVLPFYFFLQYKMLSTKLYQVTESSRNGFLWLMHA